MESQNTKEDNIISHFFKRLVVREKKEWRIFFKNSGMDDLFEYKKSTNRMFTYFGLCLRGRRYSSDERSQETGLGVEEEYFEDTCTQKRGLVWSK